MKNNNLPKTFIFDWDNTLVDSWPAIMEAINLTRSHFGLTIWSCEEVKMNCTRAARESFPEWFGEKWAEAYDFYYAGFDKIRKSRDITPLPGAESLLIALKERAIPAFIVSNKRGDYLRHEVERLNWRHFFIAIAGAQDSPRDKPARDHVDFALGQGGITADMNVWFVGDSETDMLGAHNSGCCPIFIGSPKLGESLNAAYSFNDCAALLDYLLRKDF